MSARLLVTLCLGLFSTTTWAQSPVDFGIETAGYSNYPVLQCPATNEAIKQFRKKLKDLKSAIKEEANCKGIEADVSGLSDLVTTQREDIVKLITKGQSQGLSKDEQGKVESYVQQLTEKTSNLLAVITGNDACFDEDKKGMSLDFITSLIGEGSKILAIVGGPQIGGTIQVAGEVITGFLKAMKAIQANRQGYKFQDPEQRMAYAESLCSLFDYRRELNKLIDPYDSMGRLQQLDSTLQKQVSLLKKNCIECREIVAMVDNKTAQANDAKSENDITMDDIWPKVFEDAVAAKAKAIDKLYVNKLGTHTYRSLKTLSWLPMRVRTLENNNLQADLGLEDVVSEMASIEKFMVTEQAGYFMKQLINESREWNQKIIQHLTALTYNIRVLYSSNKYLKPLPSKYPYPSTDQYFGYLLEALDVAREQVGSGDRALIRTYFKDLENLARSLTIATDVANNYCTFFEKADWYRNDIHTQCSSKALNEMREAASKYTNYRMLMPSNEVSEEAGMGGMAEPVMADAGMSDEAAQDWVESLTRLVDDLNYDQDYGRRKSTGPVGP